MHRTCWWLLEWFVSIRMAARLSHGRSSRHSQCLGSNNRAEAAAARPECPPPEADRHSGYVKDGAGILCGYAQKLRMRKLPRGRHCFEEVLVPTRRWAMARRYSRFCVTTHATTYGSGFSAARARKLLILKNGNLRRLVGARGFEPPTLRSRTVRATKLRHAPSRVRGKS